MTLEQLKTMIDEHDLTYSFSDDHRYWVAGEAQLKAINQAAVNFDRREVIALWNAAVDRKIVEGSRETFYWK